MTDRTSAVLAPTYGEIIPVRPHAMPLAYAKLRDSARDSDSYVVVYTLAKIRSTVRDAVTGRAGYRSYRARDTYK